MKNIIRGIIAALIGIGLLLGLIYLGINWGWLYGTDKESFSAFVVCLEFGCDDDKLVADHMAELEQCLDLWGVARFDDNVISFGYCLEDKGVDIYD